MGETWKAVVRWEIQQNLDAFPVLDLCAVNPGFQDQTLRVYQEVALSPLDLLATVVAALFSAYPSCLYRLAIHYPRAGLRVPFEAYPHPLVQRLVHLFPGSIHSPQTEVVVDGLPGWEVMGQKSPGTAATDYVKDSVEYLAQAMEARSPLVFWSWQESLDALPLSV
jgi:hypothetical protein